MHVKMPGPLVVGTETVFLDIPHLSLYDKSHLRL